MILDPSPTLYRVLDALEGVGLVHAVGGSLASSTFGEPRSTMDIDLLVALPAARVDALVRALGEDFYVSEDAARDAARRCASFNVIHLEPMNKVDLFVVGVLKAQRATFERAYLVDLAAQVGLGELLTRALEEAGL